MANDSSNQDSSSHEEYPNDSELEEFNRSFESVLALNFSVTNWKMAIKTSMDQQQQTGS